jgi:Caspase domain/Serpin (serine protease inhibitor)
VQLRQALYAAPLAGTPDMIKRVRQVVLLLCALAPIVSGEAAKAENRVALIIGNAAYQNTPTLANLGNDAEDMAVALKRVGFTVLFERDLNERGMERALATFARAAREADAALFYYAGHGLQYRGINYLMPIDAKLEDEFSLDFEIPRLDDVLTSLSRSRGAKILILDACRRNPLVEKLTGMGTTRDFMASRGLARLDATRGMVVAYSTQADQVAIDGTGRNSAFTAALVKQIDEPGLEIGSLFRRVAADVNQATGGRQFPELSISLLGEFYFNRADTDPSILEKAPADGGLVAINALHFKDRWKDAFDPSLTSPAPFRGVGGTAGEVPMMHLENRLRFREQGAFVAVELPYLTDRFRLVLVTTKDKPARPREFRRIASWLTGEEFVESPGEVSMPRFSLGASADLLRTLDALGLRRGRASPGALAGLSPVPMTIAQVLQRTEIRVDEAGTEAAAATAVTTTRAVTADFVKMVLDKPFLFALAMRQPAWCCSQATLGTRGFRAEWRDHWGNRYGSRIWMLRFGALPSSS